MLNIILLIIKSHINSTELISSSVLFSHFEIQLILSFTIIIYFSFASGEFSSAKALKIFEIIFDIDILFIFSINFEIKSFLCNNIYSSVILVFVLIK